MLQASKLTLWRGDTCLFCDLSFQVDAGTVLVVRGPNGAGKTTLLRVLCGLTRLEQGEVLWNGQPANSALRGLIAYSGHHSALKSDLTVRQNLEFYARLDPPRNGFDAFSALDLNRYADLEVRHLSAGQKRRAGLARIFISAAPLWLLDEPFTNMDSDGRRLVEERIRQHVASGGIAVVAAHDPLELQNVPTATLSMAGY